MLQQRGISFTCGVQTHSSMNNLQQYNIFFRNLASYFFAGSSRLHDTMFRKVMRCPVSFFDVTPPGRILQRFSRDMDECELKCCMNEDKSPSYIAVIV